jgi:hypothetical protein
VPRGKIGEPARGGANLWAIILRVSRCMRGEQVRRVVLRVVGCGLFVAEGDHGVDLHGAAGGDETGESCDGGESECYCG